MLYDVNKIRADFPILQQEHSRGKSLIYLDSAASSQRPVQVINAIDEYYRHYHANVHRGVHKLSDLATEAYEDARTKAKRFINASNRREIIFTRGTTEGINLVAQTWGRQHLSTGDGIVITQMEHHSNIVPWQLIAAEKKAKIKYVPVRDDGTLDLAVYQQLLAEGNVKLVAVVHASNVLGTLNPVKQMAQMAHKAGALIVVDAAQSVPHMPVDVQDLDVDFLALSGHKMTGPTGIGVLYGKRNLLEVMPPWMGGGEMIDRVTLESSTWNELPHKFEAGTPSIAPAIGLGAAIDYLTAIGMDVIHDYERILIDYALERLVEIPGLVVFGPEGDNRGGVVAFKVDDIHPHDMAQMLDAEGIAVRAGHHCAQPLHDCLAVNATTRASFYLYNSTDEIDRLVDGIYKAKSLFLR